MWKLQQWFSTPSGVRPLRALLRASADLLVPAICPRCQLQEIDADVTAMCSTCVAALVQPADWFCPRCAAFSHPYARQDGRCADCRMVRHRFDSAICLGAYEGELRRTIVRMKQSMEQSLTYGVGQLLAQRAITSMVSDPPDVICPVPMHWVRRISRHTSSADTLARSVAKRMSLPVRNRLLNCARQTQKQSLLGHDARRHNVAGAFRVGHSPNLSGLHVAVVDDIMTTGATMNEISRTLKRAGTRRVTALIAARATHSHAVIRSSPK